MKLLLAVTIAAATQAAPARAWVFEDDGETWPLFAIHRYGGDVNRPAATPDRPYFHGDDAVPLGLRWRDLRQAEAEAAADDAAAAASLRAETRVSARPTLRHAPRRRHVARRRPALCVPARTAAHP